MAEKDLLLRACRVAGAADVAQFLGQPVDWKLLLAAADENGVTPLLHSALKYHTAVPKSVREELQDACVRNVAHSLRLASALVEIIGLLGENGVPALAYKGPALAVLAYGNATARCFSDLDILVRRSDVDAAKAALEARGYRCTASREQVAHILRSQYHLTFAGGDPMLNIEIHWAIAASHLPFPLDAARLWSGTGSVQLLGVRIPTLDRELTLLGICAHGAKDGWPRLAWVCDLAGLLAGSPNLDWQWITQQAAKGRMRVLLLGLLLAASLLQAPVPDDLLAQAQADRAVTTVAGEIEEHLFNGNLPAGLSYHRYAWRIWNRWPDRIKYLRYAMGAIPGKLARLSHPDQADGSLPAGLSWLWRPVRLARKHRDPRRILRLIANNL